MARQVEQFQRLGELVARQQDKRRQRSDTREQVRHKLFTKEAATSDPFASARWLAAAANVCAALVMLWLRPWSEDSLALIEGADNRATGTPLIAEATSRTLRFSDGTSVTLQPQTRARVDYLDARGADVALERGALMVSVTHAADTRWVFHAGGFRVLVTGTRFWLRLDEAQHTLEVQMEEGSVAVSGPGLEQPRLLSAGQRATFGQAMASKHPAAAASIALDSPQPPFNARRDMRSAATPEPSVAIHGSAESADGGAGAGSAAGPAVGAGGTAASAVPSHGGWRALAAAGEYHRAYTLVAPEYPTLLTSLNAASLDQLATVARLSGHGGHARQAYLSLRTRFAGGAAAAGAAFSLGNLSFGTRPSEAARWYRSYLSEAPSGGYAAAARGRLLELARRSGAASAAATDYLRHHPDGPHAEMARQVIAKESSQ